MVLGEFDVVFNIGSSFCNPLQSDFRGYVEHSHAIVGLAGSDGGDEDD